MWKWIAGRLKPRHALDRELGSPRALRRFIAQLPAHQPEPALEAVAAIFDQSRDLGLAPAERLQALAELDEFAQRFRHELSARLLDNSPKQVLCENAWNQLFRYYRALDAGYAAAMEALGMAGTDAESHTLATVAACRAMHAMAKCNMLLRMRYREASTALWPRIERLLADARTRSQAVATLALYPDDPVQTSIVREYLVALLFEMAPASNLLPAQIHAVDLLLRQHAEDFRVGEAFNATVTPFTLDPAGDAKPMRWLPGLTTKPGVRFFGLGEAYPRIVVERERAARTRSIPEWLAPSQLSSERYRELLDWLAAQWAVTPPVRRQRRESGAGEILVAHDFGQIRRLISFSHLACTGRSLEYDRFSAYAINDMVRGHNDAQLRAPGEAQAISTEEALKNLETFERALDEGTTEAWRIVDTSEDGLGAEVVAKGAWAKAGMLIAYRRTDSAHWAMAVVRRLNRASNDTLRIGLRKLPGVPYCARVNVNDPRQPNPGKAATAPTLNYDAIKLVSDESCLLLPPGIFDPAWRYTMTVGHRWDFIRMQRCIECGLDFELVEIAVVKAQQAA